MDDTRYTGNNDIKETFPYVCKTQRLLGLKVAAFILLFLGIALLFSPGIVLGIIFLPAGLLMFALCSFYRVTLRADELVLDSMLGERHIARSDISGWEVRKVRKAPSVRYIYLTIGEGPGADSCELSYTDVCDGRLVGWLSSLDLPQNKVNLADFSAFRDLD